MSRHEVTTRRERTTDAAPCPMTLGRDLVRSAADRLNAIRGYCELAMVKGENGDALARRMSAAIAAVDEMTELISELSARFEGGRSATL